MMRASSLRQSLSPSRFLLLAAALVALMAVFLVGDGAPPAQASHTLPTPTNVVATALDGSVRLTWTAVSGANAYRIEYGEELSGTTTTTTSNANASTVSSLTNGRFYRFRVQAYQQQNAHDTSAYSGWVTALPRATAPTTQVSNLGQTGPSTTGFTNWSGAQGFTTGANTAGYTLSSIDVQVGTALNAAAAAKVRAELWSSTASGSPDELLETLEVPNTLSAGVNTFTAPLGTVLAPETTYHIVFYTNSDQTLTLNFSRLSDEDASSAEDFSIADSYNFLETANPHSPGSETWTAVVSIENFKIAVKGAARPVGSGKPIWSATLNPNDVGNSYWGCTGSSTTSCGTHSILSNRNFTYNGLSRSIALIEHKNLTDRERELRFGTGLIGTPFRDMTLHVGGRTLAIADATVTHTTSNSLAVWTSTGMTWAATDTIRVILTIPEASSNNNLRTLTASTATSETGTYTTQTLTPAFTPGTQRYAVTVGNAVTHARLTPTVDDTGKATVQVGKGSSFTDVTSGSASNPIALDVGDNALLAWVTAENGDRRYYRVNIRRQSGNANLLGLFLGAATSETGNYIVQTLTPPFSPGTTVYSVRVDFDNTHARVTPRSDVSEATLKMGKTVATLATVNSGRHSDPIALEPGANEIIVRVTAEDTSITRDYTVTVNRDGTPQAPTDLTVTPGSHALDLTWTAPGVTVDGYDVHYTAMAAVDLADDADSGSNRHPHLGWVDIGKSDRAPKTGIGGLNPGQVYRVRVRAYNSHGIGPWAVAPPPVWDAMLEVANLDGGNTGCDQTDANATCTNNFTNWSFTYKGVTYRPFSAKSFGNGDFQLNFYTGPDMTALEPLTLRVGATELSMADAGLSTSNQLATWNNRPGILPSGQSVNFYLFDPTAHAANIPAEAPLTVSLAATPERVREGDPVTITATVMREGLPVVIQEDLDVLLSTHLGTAEAGDVSTPERISIGKNTSSGSATIQTHRDGDGNDETFAVLIRWIPKSDFAKVGHPAIVWVTITEGDPAPPEPEVQGLELQASGGDGVLYLSWQEQWSNNDGYDVQYKLSSAADQPATTAGDPATGWVDAGHTGKERSLTITGLTNWVDYDVRVRPTFPDRTGPWSDVVTAYPQAPVELGNPRAVTVTISDTTAEEKEKVTLTATLDEPAPREGATVQFWAYGNSIGGTVNGATVWLDYRLSPPDPGLEYRDSDTGQIVKSVNDFTTAPITIRPGQTTATATLAVQGGHGDEGTEGIRVYATATVPDADHRYGRWALTSPTVTMTIYEQGQSPTVSGNQGSPPEQPGVQPTAVTLALGQTAVSESAGTVTITATLDAPAPEGGLGGFLFAGGDSTAADGIDFTLPFDIFIPGGQRSRAVTISITDDAEDESDETVVVTAYFDLGTAVLEDKITLTITDDDTAGVTITAASPLAVDEGATATYTVVLDSQPTADVTITASSGNVDAASVSPASYTFTSSTWNTAQTFTVSGVADTDTNDETVGISHGVTSDDAKYAAVLMNSVSVSVSDTTQEQLQQEDPPANRAPTVASVIGNATIVNESGSHQVSLSGVFSDADGDSLTMTAGSSDEAVATVSVASDGSSLTVTAKGRGTATITVTADDGRGGTVDDEFTIKVKAAPTVASAISDVSGLEAGSTQDVSLSGVFSDADGDALTFTASSSNNGKATVSVASDGSKLTLAGVADGTATITVTAQDSDGNRVSGDFSVAVVQVPEPPQQEEPNQAPTVASAIDDATIVNESGTQTVSLSGTFSDADSDTLTISAKSSDTTVATVSVASDSSSLTVKAQARGNATITVTANDGRGGTVDDEFTVTVKAAPTVASAISDVSGLEAGSTQDVSLSGVFSDADGDALTFTADTSDSTVADAILFQGTLTVIAVADGTATITVTARDSDGNTLSDTFDVSVVGPPTPVGNLRCIAKTDQVAFLWDAPEWSGGEVYAYDYDLTMPDGTREQVRLQGFTLVNKPGEYQAGTTASISVQAVYELADGSEVSSAAAALTCTVAE